MAETIIDLLKNSSYIEKMDALINAVKASSSGDMLKSTYDPTGSVATAGGIPNYVEVNAPVTSVNSKTGAVTFREVPDVTTADNGKFLRVVNGEWTAVEIANANGGSF